MFAMGNCCLPKKSGIVGLMDLKRFGRIVYQRRTELGLTQEDVARNGGPTDTTLGKIENGEWNPGNRKVTLRKLDTGLRWTEGSAQRALAGGDPSPIGSIDPTRESEHQFHGGAYELITDHTRFLVDLAIEADEVDSSASAVNTDVTDSDDVEQVAADLDSLMIAIDRLTQLVNDEALRWLGSYDTLRALKSDAIRRRRLLRLGRKDAGPDLVARMVEIQREVSSAGMTENDFAFRLLAEAEQSAVQYPEPDMFEEFIKKEKADGMESETEPSAPTEGDKGKEVLSPKDLQDRGGRTLGFGEPTDDATMDGTQDGEEGHDLPGA